jgi:arylsulfatase A-like enzyme/Flp pilus assembly protein TadD
MVLGRKQKKGQGPRAPAAEGGAAARPARRPRLWGPALLLAAGALAFGLASLMAPREKREAGLSVLLVSIDTLRSDALGAYGRANAGTPFIDRLAGAGVRFQNVHAHNVVTLASHSNMLSGRYPFEHGVRDNSGFRFPKDVPTLATLLKQHGYATAAFVSAFVLDARFGLDRGFDVYDDRLGGAEARSEFLVPERHAEKTVAAATAWLARAGSAPRFLFLHIYEPHFPYEPPEPYRSRYASEPYQGEVAAADAALGPLLAPLLAEGARGNLLVVLTGDHGESLGSHGEMTHGIFGYEETLRVPLILYCPRLLKPRVVSEPARHVDLLPTLLDALALQAPPGLSGRSLWPLAFGRSLGPAPVYFEALSSSLNRGWAPLHGVLADGLKYVDLPEPELYDLRADPAEERNLAARRPVDLERLKAVLGGFTARDRGISRVAEEAEALEHLRALGYVAAAASQVKQTYGKQDDPKNLVAIDTRIRDVVSLYRSGDLKAAIALCRQNIAERPEMPVSYLHLAYLERGLGNLETAVAAARRSFELRPLDAEAVSLYAIYLTEAGHAAEAVKVTAPYVGRGEPDLDVLTARGMALARLGRFDDARATFEIARTAHPTNALTLVNVGTVELMAGSRDAAQRSFEAALAIDSSVARAHNSLGVIAMTEGHGEEAVEHWQRAVELDPRDYQTLFNLGDTLRRMGRDAEARRYLEAYLREAPLALERRDIERVRAWLGRAS